MSGATTQEKGAGKGRKLIILRKGLFICLHYFGLITLAIAIAITVGINSYFLLI